MITMRHVPPPLAECCTLRVMERERIDVAINQNSQREERRMQDGLIIVERRRGKFILYGQAILFLSLVTTLLWLLIN